MCLAAASGVAVAAAKLLLVRWRPGILVINFAFEVICRVTVMIVTVAVSRNLTYNGSRV